MNSPKRTTADSAAALPARTPTQFFSLAIFGLSANPPTGEMGHAGIVRSLVECKRFDEVWVFPVYRHMYSSKQNLESFDHRMAMSEIAFCKESRAHCTVKVVPIEKEAYEAALVDAPNKEKVSIGTIDIIRFIQRRFAEKSIAKMSSGVKPAKREILKLHLVLGADTFRDVMRGKWKDSLG
jgi:nicotinic acid mononucleotide adenylyltransferase